VKPNVQPDSQEPGPEIRQTPAVFAFAKPCRERSAEGGWRRGRDSNPRRMSPPLTVFETAPFNHSGTPPQGPDHGTREPKPAGPTIARGIGARRVSRILHPFRVDTVSPVRIVRLRAPSAGERALFVAGIRQRAHIAAGAGAQVDDMYAVIRTGGKQYRVAENDVVVVERIAGEAGDEVTLGDVLMVAGDGDVK